MITSVAEHEHPKSQLFTDRQESSDYVLTFRVKNWIHLHSLVSAESSERLKLDSNTDTNPLCLPSLASLQIRYSNVAVWCK